MTLGPRNLITDVAGLKVGNAEDERLRSGVTVIMGDQPFCAAVDIRGGAPGTRDVAVLAPENLVTAIDGICLSGGSAFGNDAVSGLQSFLRAQGQGYQIAPDAPLVPVVCGAILFDLNNGGDKSWGEEPPYRQLGLTAAQRAGGDFALGNAGAGMGAACGRLKGGLGSASWCLDDGTTVGALVAVNAVGSALMPHSDAFWAWPFEQQGEFGGRRPGAEFSAVPAALPSDMKLGSQAGANTTIAVVATDAALDKLELRRVAIMAADGFARALRPVHTPFDGDLVFAISTGRSSRADKSPLETMQIGHVAADCLARAIARGVYEARSVGRLTSYREFIGR
ncbi:MAG: P1 family peptidase [Rhizomicrobium sp.]